MPMDVYELPLADDMVDEPEEPDFDKDLQGLVKEQVERALSWKEEYLDREMAKATDYYMGRPYGDEREGRSQIVTTEVRNAVSQTMPSLMRVFTSSEMAVEFKPRDANDIEVAKRQTATVNYIFYEDNPGFLILHSAIKDALVRKLGIIKWHWADQDKVLGSEHTGLTQADLDVLEQDPDIEIETREERTMEIPGPDGVPQTVPVYDVAILRSVTEGRAVVEAVPPEEFIWSPNAKGLADAIMVGHTRDVAASELVEMGVPWEVLKDRLGSSVETNDDSLSEARRFDRLEDVLYEEPSDDTMRPVRFTEVYIKYDSDDDKVAEIHKVHAVGEDYYIHEDEIVDEVPFAVFRIDPEPHTLIGLSQADFVMDLQHIISHITRGMLDSLVSHLNPAMEVVENEVNMQDAKKQELGRLIRVRRPGMMREIVTPFVGGSALPVLEQMHAQVANRVGVSAMTDGLEPDVLQSTTASAVQATVEAGKQRVEMMARMLAETGFRDLFKGLLRLVVKHQDQPMVIRLQGEFVAVDPRHWDADKDVMVNVALGSGMIDQKIAHLMQIAQKQESHIQQGSPIVDLTTLRATYARIVELMGFKNPDAFFKPFGPEEAQAYAKQKAESQKPTETEVFEKIEMAKIQARSQEKQAEIQMRMAELQLKKLEIESNMTIQGWKLKQEVDSEQADRTLESAKFALDAEMKRLQGLKTASETRIGDAP